MILIDVGEFSSLEAVPFSYPTSSVWKWDWLCLDTQGSEPDSVRCVGLRCVILRSWSTKEISLFNPGEYYLIDLGF